jgi:hypothetical protein
MIQNQPETTRSERPKAPVVAPAPVIPKLADSSVARRVIPRRKDSALIQVNIRRRDSLTADSLKKATATAVRLVPKDTTSYNKYQTHPYLPLDKPPVFMLIDYHKQESRDELFYLMAGLVFCLAFVRVGFPKYFRNLFLLFFQTSLRQKHTREQLLQDNLASLFINLLFFISMAMYLALLIKYRNLTPASFWLLTLICGLALILIYLGKYLFLVFAGWVFNTKEAAGSYIFLVFLVNKVMGVALIPFLLILSFAAPPVVDVAITVSLGMIGVLFTYRYFVSFSAIRNKLKVNVLHFFLYLCAVEVLPLLLIYKLLINYITGSF